MMAKASLIKNGTYDIQKTHWSRGAKHDKNPKVRKTGVDAVHESCPWSSMWKIVICNMCMMMTEIKTIDGGQKDELLRRASIKKSFLLTCVELQRQILSSIWKCSGFPLDNFWKFSVDSEMVPHQPMTRHGCSTKYFDHCNCWNWNIL